MKICRLAIILAVMVLPAWSWAQTAGQNSASPAAVRILAPKAGDRLQQTFVTVQYELASPGAAAGTPNFRVQLDNRDPVTTNATQQDFTGMTPGRHSVTVRLVDANNTPIAGSETAVEFVTVAPPAPAPRATLPQSDQDQALATDAQALPSASSALPLLSVIGFGALVGGIASALKTR